MKQRKERDEKIRNQIQEYITKNGFSLTVSLELTAKQFYLSYSRVKDIYYGKNV
ncbi:MAG TPA: hypothetical protein PLV22_00215 [Candidatus Cloacimonadota bacterium]|nr:hypothetical protein [Candidatus Cloacimonadota bacterium]